MLGKYCFLEQLSKEYDYSISTEHQVQHAHLIAAATQHDLALQQALYKPALKELEREIVLSQKQLHQTKEAFAKWFHHDAEIGGPTSQLKLWVLEEGRVIERPHCAPQRSSRKHVSLASSSTSLISSVTTPSACGGGDGFSHLGFCACTI